MSKTDKPEKPAPIYTKKNILSIITLTFGILFLLSLWTYSQSDAEIMNQVSSNNWAPENSMGKFGAYISHGMFFTFGAGAYVVAWVLIISAIRKLFVQKSYHFWEYCVAFFLVLLGSSMIFGTLPECYKNPVEGMFAGGCVGQFFCSPDPESIGFCYNIVNKTGCLILSSIIMSIGFITLWWYDWRGVRTLQLVKAMNDKFKEFTSIFARSESSEPKPKKEKPAKAAKKVKPAKEPKEKKQSSFFDNFKPKSDVPVANTSRDLSNFTRHEEPATPAPTPIQPTISNFEMPKATPKQDTSRFKPKPSPDGSYQLPPMSLLSANSNVKTTVNASEIERKKQLLQNTLESFRIDARVTEVTAGPRVTLFEIVPAPGVNVKKITGIEANLAMELKAHSLRILAPIPGKNSVGLEVPNEKAVAVDLRHLLENKAWQNSGMQIPLALGKDISGTPICLDLAKAPHLLIAGATGSGKSVCMNTIIASMLYRYTPEEMKMILVDPKVVEFKNYEILPHLVTPVVNDPQKVTLALHWAVKEMDRRYKILAQCGVKNLEAFNKRPKAANLMLDEDGKPIPDKMPFLVIIIDELADIMMTAKGDVETCLARIAQLGRASGIHAIVATQRPSVNVITGIIKANFPTRIAFKVTSAVDSRTILDSKGAEQLLGQGDMLFNPPGASQLLRIQGAYVPEEELESVVAFVGEQQAPEFDTNIIVDAEAVEESSGNIDMTPSPGFTDNDLNDAEEELLQKAVKVILEKDRATISFVQRSLRIGYNKAADIIQTLEDRGIVGPQIGSKPREILINRD